MAKLIKLIDTSRCTACRGCQVACKNWNRNPAGKIERFKGNYQTRKDTNAVTYTIVKMDEYVDRLMGCSGCSETSVHALKTRPVWMYVRVRPTLKLIGGLLFMIPTGV